jgi:hypothetical protein
VCASRAFAADEATPVASGTGKTKFNALLQAWALNDTSAVTPNKSNFRLRRAEIKFSGSVVENTRWFVMADPSKSLTSGAVASTNDNKILQDLGLAYALAPELEFTVGQFKTPATAEGLDSSAELLFPERSLVASTFGDRRELGAQLQFKSGIFKATGMVSQGTVANTVDANNEKDLTLRLDAKPVDFLSLGAFTTAPDSKWSVAGRFGFNARLAYEQALVRFEYAQQDGSGGKSSGWAADAGYLVTESLQPIFRYESFSPRSTLTGKAYAFGANYLLAKQSSKIALTYTILDNMLGAKSSTNPGSLAAASNIKGGLLILAFQTAI